MTTKEKLNRLVGVTHKQISLVDYHNVYEYGHSPENVIDRILHKALQKAYRLGRDEQILKEITRKGIPFKGKINSKDKKK